MKKLVLIVIALLLISGCSKKPSTAGKDPVVNPDPITDPVNKKTDYTGNYSVTYQEDYDGEQFTVTYWIILKDDYTGYFAGQDVSRISWNEDGVVQCVDFEDSYQISLNGNVLTITDSNGNSDDYTRNNNDVPDFDAYFTDNQIIPGNYVHTEVIQNTDGSYSEYTEWYLFNDDGTATYVGNQIISLTYDRGVIYSYDENGKCYDQSTYYQLQGEDVLISYGSVSSTPVHFYRTDSQPVIENKTKTAGYYELFYEEVFDDQTFTYAMYVVLNEDGKGYLLQQDVFDIVYDDTFIYAAHPEQFDFKYKYTVNGNELSLTYIGEEPFTDIYTRIEVLPDEVLNMIAVG